MAGSNGHDDSGGKGDELGSDTRHRRRDLALINRAIRKGWKIPKEALKACPKIAFGIVKEGKTDREKTRAMEVLIKMKGQNEGTHSTVDVGIGIATGEAVRDAMGVIESDARYQEHLRSGAADSDASAICEAGLGGDADALEAREASRRNGSGGNGRAAGRNGDSDG